MSNFYSSPWFLDVAAEVLFPGQGARPGTVEVEGRLFDVLLREDGATASMPEFVDFLEPRDTADGRPTDVMPARRLPFVCRAIVPFLHGQQEDPGNGLLAAPRVDWSRFDTWDAFVTEAEGRCSHAFGKSARKLRKLAREIGPTRFTMDEPDHKLLEIALMWKSQQLRRTGRLDLWVSRRYRQFFHRLVESGHLKLSALFVADRPVAVNVSCPWQERYCCWLATYDQEFSRYSPGVLLFEYMMKESREQGFKEFDFLLGDETYKYYYATDVRLVGPLGRPPLRERAWKPVRGRIVGTVRDRFPGAYRRARRLIRDIQQERLARDPVVQDLDKQSSYLAIMERNTGSWPQPGFESSSDCQLLLFLSKRDVETSPAESAWLSWLRIQRRIKWIVWRRIVNLLDWIKGTGKRERPSPLGLRAGELVRVKTRDEIERTLDGGVFDRLYYIPGVMDRHGGRVFRVQRRVVRFFDERQRRIVKVRNTVVLDRACCDGSQVTEGQGCDRGCLVFWKEAWLERLSDGPIDSQRDARPDAMLSEVAGEANQHTRAPSGMAQATASDENRLEPGDLVRVRELHEIDRTLDAQGACGGVHFVRQTMSSYAGKTFRVLKRLASAHDERSERVFTVSGAVLLDGVYCRGAMLTSGGVCDRSCVLFWREEWLERVPS